MKMKSNDKEQPLSLNGSLSLWERVGERELDGSTPSPLPDPLPKGEGERR
jgi:hypothetical protein